jgi:hypothetical protein
VWIARSPSRSSHPSCRQWLAPPKRSSAILLSCPQAWELRTDHGLQYTGHDCELMCELWRLEHTFAPVDRPTGNAAAERFIRARGRRRD